MRERQDFLQTALGFSAKNLESERQMDSVLLTENQASTQVDFTVHLRASCLTHGFLTYEMEKLTADSTHKYIKRRLAELRRHTLLPSCLGTASAALLSPGVQNQLPEKQEAGHIM